MTNSSDLTKLESHFAFGENWAAYAAKVGSEEIAEAEKGLERLCGGRLDGLRFLDIGCGSGVHSLSALRLGAAEVVSVDIDPDAVMTTKAVLTRHAAGSAPRVEPASVFDMEPSKWGQFDVVYSWGVLHHTGDMYRALRAATALVRPGGRFVFALYRKTWMCGFWRLEKRWYRQASKRGQEIAASIYVRLFSLKMGARFKDYVRDYRGSRGMDFYHDVHDWLGGYPYESISSAETDRFMRSVGFTAERVFARKARFFGRDSGLFGSWCDEYTYVRDLEAR